MAKQKHMRRKGPVAVRLAAYRPVLDRVVFGVALLGLVVTAHLYIQQGRGFDRGCLGFSEPSAASAGCAIVTQSEASTLFGVSNAIWGFVFYLAVVGLSLALPFVVRQRQPLVKRARAALIAFGFLYSLYLVYFQSIQLDTFCALCLTSAGLVATLFVLQVVDYVRPPDPAPMSPSAMSPASPSRQGLVLGGLVVAVFVLIGADFAYFNSIAVAPAGDLAFDPNAEPVSQQVYGPGECRYDPNLRPVADYASYVNAIDPIRGNPDAPVTVIEFFDVNCPHCKTLHPIMEQVIAEHGERARFVYKPFVIFQQSVAQTAALYAAAQEGKFFEMLDLQFEAQNPRGLSAEQLRGMARQIGIDPDLMIQRVESGLFMSFIQMQQRLGQEAGLRSVPSVMINGRVVETASKTPECLGQLITAAAAAN